MISLGAQATLGAFNSLFWGRREGGGRERQSEFMKMLSYSCLELVIKDVPEGIHDVMCVQLEDAQTKVSNGIES